MKNRVKDLFQLILGAVLVAFSAWGQADSLALSSAPTVAGGTASLNLSLNSPGGQTSGLQWTISYSPAEVAALSVSAGPAATAAGKSLTCNSTAGTATCVLTGMNATAIGSGVIAVVDATMAPSTTATSIAVNGSRAASLNGGSVSSTASGGSITVPVAVTLSSLSCTPASLQTPGSSTCTAGLSGVALSGGFKITLASSSTALSVPASITVPAGAGSVTFTATASAVTSSQNAVVTASAAGVSKTASIALTAPSLGTISSVLCGSGTLLSGDVTSCTVTLSSPAPAGGSPVVLTKNDPALSAPASVTVPANATTASFALSAGTITSDHNAVLTATLNGSSKSATLSLVAPATLSSLQCNPANLTAGLSATCTVSLSKPAPATGFSVTLASSSTAVTLPASVALAGGAASATFSITAGTVASSQSAVLTATLSGISRTATVTVVPAGTQAPFHLSGDVSELSGNGNGAIVTPSAAPSGLTGTLTVRGTGAASFAPAAVGDGVSFLQGGQQNQNSAFYSFTGSQVQNIFNLNQGEISFYLKSRYSFAGRKALPQNNSRWVFDAYDNNRELFYFMVESTSTRVMFQYQTGGTSSQYYYLPAGQEDQLFGKDVVLQIKLEWDGAKNKLYLNGNLVRTVSYTKATPNWTSSSSFTVGSRDIHAYGGGFYSCDDILDDLQILSSPTGTAPPLPPAITPSSLSCTPSSLSGPGASNCSVGISSAAPAGGSPIALSSNSTALSVPASVTVPAGSTSSTFTATAGVLSSNQTAIVTATAAGVSKTASVTLAVPHVLSSLLCGSNSLLSGDITSCTVTLSNSAPTGGSVVALAKNDPALAAPASVTVPAGSTAASFTLSAGTITSDHNAVLTATLGSTSQSATLALVAPATLSSLQCNPANLTAGLSATCTVSLSKPGPATGLSVTLASSSTAVTVPASVALAGGAASATFSITAGAVASSQSAVLTATLSGISRTATVTVVPAGIQTQFYLSGEPSELSGSGNGAIVNPTTAPSGLTGTLTVRGTGAASFAPAAVGDGVSFLQGGQQNQNSAFYSFTGSQVQNIFDLNQGEINFYLKSRYSFAGRKALPQNNSRWVFDAYDNNRELFYFMVETTSTRVMFQYQTGGTSSQYYYLPAGQEDQLFGKDVVLQIKLEWDGAKNKLYLNGNLVRTVSYTKASPNWTSSSSLTVGSRDIHAYGGGFYSSDDVLDDLQILAPTAPGSFTSSAVSPGRNTLSGRATAMSRDSLGDQRTLAAASSAQASSRPSIETSLTNGRPAATAIVNGASQSAERACTPGSIAAVLGDRLAPTESPVTDESGTATELAGLRVKVNDDYVPVLSAGATEVKFLCPMGQYGSKLAVSVETLSGSTAPLPVVLQDAAPGIFSIARASTAQSSAAERQAAQAGDTLVIRATGLGLAPETALAVRIGGIAVPANSIESVAESAGVSEIRVKAPAGAPLGDAVPVVLQVLESSGTLRDSNTATIAIEPVHPLDR